MDTDLALLDREQIGLQQILQNITNDAVNVDDMDSLEKALVGSCEEMMRLIRESPSTEFDGDGNDDDVDHHDSDDDNNSNSGDDTGLHTGRATATTAPSGSKKLSLTAENFTSPFNIRVPLKQREPYFVPGINYDSVPKVDDRGTTRAAHQVETSFLYADRFLCRVFRERRNRLRCHGPRHGQAGLVGSGLHELREEAEGQSIANG